MKGLFKHCIDCRLFSTVHKLAIAFLSWRERERERGGGGRGGGWGWGWKGTVWRDYSEKYHTRRRFHFFRREYACNGEKEKYLEADVKPDSGIVRNEQKEA